jgi:cyclohexadienyl dehydratase
VSLTCCGKVQADPLAGIRARGTLRVGVSGDYRPFSFCVEGETDCEGFDVEVARRAAADLGVQVTFVRFRWPQLLDDLDAEKFDMAMSGITIRPERLLRATFTRPYAVAAAVVLVTDAKRFATLAAVDQPSIRVAVNAGGHLERLARARFRQATILPTTMNLSLPDLVVRHQAEALLTDSFEAPHFLATHPTLRALPAFGRDRKAYIVRRADGELREWLDQWLLARETDGFLTGLRALWLGRELVRPHPLAALFALMEARLALMPAIANYKRHSNLPIEDTQQEQKVLKQVTTQARTLGTNEQDIQNVFKVQITLAKNVQQAALQNVSQENPIPLWARALDLHNDLRPALEELNDRIVRELLNYA